MLKKTIASVQLGVVRSEATALVRRVTEFGTHAILKTFRREVFATRECQEKLAGQESGMISIPLISGLSALLVKLMSSLPSVMSTLTVSM